MNRVARVSALCAVLALCAVPLTAQEQTVVAGYYPAWNRSVLPPAQIRLPGLTHVIHAFAWPLADGTIQGYADVPDAELVAVVHAAAKNVLIALGGAGQGGGFVDVATNPVVRNAFVGNLTAYILVNGYDGVDIDWESPSTAAQRDSLVSLVREIRAAFDGVDTTLLITMAVPVGPWFGQWFNFTKLLPYVDWFNAMTYDFHGSWTNHAGHNAPLYAPATDPDGSVAQGIQYLRVTRGIPSNKLALGLPFYGREFLAAGLYQPSSGATDVLYSDAVSRISQGWTYAWDAVSQVPYLVDSAKTKTVTYDDSTSLTIKCQYAKTQQLAGVMIWALGQDLVSGDQPLLDAVELAMSAPSAVLTEHANPLPEGFALLPNYPNPCNPSTMIGFRITVSGLTRVVIHDVLGREVATLVSEMLSPGEYWRRWDARGMAGGIYICRLEQGSRRAARTIVLLR